MEQLFSPKTLASILGLAEQTIYNRHSTGGNLPPVIKLGRLLRFRPTDVEAWLEKQTCVPEPPASPNTKPLPLPPRRPGRPTKAEQMARRKNQ